MAMDVYFRLIRPSCSLLRTPLLFPWQGVRAEPPPKPVFGHPTHGIRRVKKLPVLIPSRGNMASCVHMLALWLNGLQTTLDLRWQFHQLQVLNLPDLASRWSTIHIAFLQTDELAVLRLTCLMCYLLNGGQRKWLGVAQTLTGVPHFQATRQGREESSIPRLISMAG